MNFKPLIQKLGLSILTFGQRVFCIQDIDKAERRGARLTKLLWYLDKKHRTQAIANVGIAFPDKTEAERIAMAKEMFRHFGRIIADFIRTPLRTDDEVVASVTCEGREHLDRLGAEGNGIFLVTAHYGNWERMGHWLRTQGHHVSAVARDANDNAVNERVNRIRGENGMQVLSRGNAAREIIRRLKAGEMVGLLPDQNADDAYIPFFGKPAGTVLGPAVLHIKTKAPLLPVCCIRTGPGTYRVIFFEPMTVREGETSIELMTRLNQVIEDMIRIAPEQYLWMHDRWRNARRKGLL
jgi:Kdo2-lipid IVA lauroyltransferase/acyltransferase